MDLNIVLAVICGAAAFVGVLCRVSDLSDDSYRCDSQGIKAS